MTIKEFIKKLKKFDENLIVVIDDADTNWELALKLDGIYERNNKLYLSAIYRDQL